MGSIHYGVHKTLEGAANELLRESLHGVTSMSEKSDILTPWKEQDRRNREVYSHSGAPDASVRSGLYNRAWNSHHEHLNSRDGIARATRRGMASMQEFVENHGQGGLYADGNARFDDPQ